MYNIQISKNKKTRNYRCKIVVSIANLQYWADSKSIKFLFLNIYLIIFIYFARSRMVRWKRYPRASEVRARQEVSGSLIQFLRYCTVHCFLRSVFQGTTWFFEDFRDTKYFLWNVIIPLKISLQKSYGTLGFQRTKVTPLRDTAKFQKKYRGSRRS